MDFEIIMGIYIGKSIVAAGGVAPSDWKTYFDNGGNFYADDRVRTSIKTLAPYLSFTDTADVTDFTNMFRNNKSLATIPSLDMRKGTLFTDMLTDCAALTSFGGYGMSCSFDMSPCTLMEESALVEVLNNLADVTSKEAQTLTLGETLLAKLTDAEKKIATDKNWTLA